MQLALLSLAILPFEAMMHLDAICRSLWRVVISHRSLLEWQATSQHPLSQHKIWYQSLLHVWIAPCTAIAMAGCIYWLNPSALIPASLVLLSWLIAPVYVAWLGHSPRTPILALGREEQAYLRGQARKIWLFFEHHVNEANHFLPVDNVQEFPVAAVARRTSPTNMGLALLANLTAYDFGYLAIAGLLQRSRRTLTAMASLERHRGHFFNWYDTQAMTVMAPAYISTVDSGNLIAHLLILQTGLSAIRSAPIVAGNIFVALLDCFHLLHKQLNSNSSVADNDVWVQMDVCLRNAAALQHDDLRQRHLA